MLRASNLCLAFVVTAQGACLSGYSVSLQVVPGVDDAGEVTDTSNLQSLWMRASADGVESEHVLVLDRESQATFRLEVPTDGALSIIVAGCTDDVACADEDASARGCAGPYAAPERDGTQVVVVELFDVDDDEAACPF